jgi:hypothetical protein
MVCTAVRDEMLDVLYDEAEPAARRRVEDHLGSCADCRAELAGLRRLRGELPHWKLPAGLAQGRKRPLLPRRLTVAAAVAAGLIVALGAALGLSGSELRYQDGRVAFRLGRGGADLEPLLAAQEARHREEIRALRASLGPEAPAEDRQLSLRQVQDLIRLSEARQAALLRTSLAELNERSEAQRNYDMARVSAGLSYLDGKTGEHVARTTELMGYVLQAAQRK